MGKVICKDCGESVKVSLIKARTPCKNCGYAVALNHWSMKVLIVVFVMIANVLTSGYSMFWAEHVEGMIGMSRRVSNNIFAIIVMVVIIVAHRFLSCFIYNRIKVIRPMNEMVEWELNEPNDENLPWGRRREL